MSTAFPYTLLSKYDKVENVGLENAGMIMYDAVGKNIADCIVSSQKWTSVQQEGSVSWPGIAYLHVKADPD